MDRDFSQNGYLYLLYTYDVAPLQPHSAAPMVARLPGDRQREQHRVRGDGAGGQLRLGAVPTGVKALGCIPSDGASHSIGRIRVDPNDGTLWVGVGDSADFNRVDELAYRGYDEQNLAGKLLHVDRNGRGLSRHPFSSANGDLTGVCIPGVVVSRTFPCSPLRYGRLGSDAATLFAGLGIVALALGLYTPHGRAAFLVPAVPLLAAPLAADQRAAFIGPEFSALVLIAAIVRWERRTHVTPTEVSLLALGVTACLLAPSVTALALGQDPPAPLCDNLSTTFTSREEELTTEARVNQLRVAAPLMAERPVFRWGLGRSTSTTSRATASCSRSI